MGTDKPSILIVDDNPALRQGLGQCFSEADFVVYTASDGHQGIQEARLKNPSAILLDLNLPDISGFEVVDVLKKNLTTCGIPILVFTAHHQDGQLIESREHGADGYLVKGGPWEQVLGYIQVLILSSAAPKNAEKLVVGPVSIDPKEHRVLVANKPVPPLTPKEFDLLHFVALKSPEVIPWEKIAKNVWKEPAKYGKDSKTIELHAQRIRKKLGSDASKFIITHKGVGLQFISTLSS
ncbi:MAG: response regulator transcription factor [Elusimicrobia bacterium]|nr:response regulator transcription factor [Elusimicrobiota bacterium]